MNDHEINIAIAEACGWIKCRLAIKGAGGGIRQPTAYGFPPKRNYEAPCPDYLNDLNAMHEAENTLTEQQHAWYSDYLYDIACNYQKMTGKWRYLSLNARQRAEAFLRTLGKWKD